MKKSSLAAQSELRAGEEIRILEVKTMAATGNKHLDNPLRDRRQEDHPPGYEITKRIAAVAIKNLRDIEQRLLRNTSTHTR
jgi:hypothetical protein